MPVQQLLNLRWRDAPRFCHSRKLCRSRSRAEMGIEPAGGCGQQIRGNGAAELRVLFVKFFCISLDAVHKLLICRAEIRGSRIRSVVAITGRRGPSLEILWLREFLPDKL